MESSFLVNSWLLGAFSDGLDVNPLLDSQILSTVCDVTILEHFDKWPHFHKDTEQMTENYDKSFMELMHDEMAY
jgi:predicted oxidoreductase